MIAMNHSTAARVEAHLGLLADRIEFEALYVYPFPSGEIAEAIGQGNAIRKVAMEVRNLAATRRRRRYPAPLWPVDLGPAPEGEA